MQDNRVKAAKESGHCGDTDVFMVFADPPRLGQDQVRSGLYQTAADTMTPVSLLVGPNWIINAPPEITRALASSSLGGDAEYWDPATPTP